MAIPSSFGCVPISLLISLPFSCICFVPPSTLPWYHASTSHAAPQRQNRLSASSLVARSSPLFLIPSSPLANRASRRCIVLPAAWLLTRF
ncbi:hypothetical protein V8C35DRAFT_308946 [Trichoderma chlorosporum]